MKPYLIDSLKFDFRIYVLICNVVSLKIFIYREGIARFCTKKYKIPSKLNVKLNQMHLTNYAINKSNPSFIFNERIKEDHFGHKRSLSSVFRVCKILRNLALINLIFFQLLKKKKRKKNNINARFLKILHTLNTEDKLLLCPK